MHARAQLAVCMRAARWPGKTTLYEIQNSCMGPAARACCSVLVTQIRSRLSFDKSLVESDFTQGFHILIERAEIIIKYILAYLEKALVNSGIQRVKIRRVENASIYSTCCYVPVRYCRAESKTHI